MKKVFVASLALSLLTTACWQKVESPPEKPASQPVAKPGKAAVKSAARPAVPAPKKGKAKSPEAKKNKAPAPRIVGTTNKSALSYQPGEEMIYTFKLELDSAKPGKWFLKYVRRGDDNQTFSGQVPADQVLTVKTSLDRPGFVSVNVYLVDEKGKPVWGDMLRGGGRIVRRKIAFFGGTAVHPEKLTDCGEPADFDAFWERQKKRLAEVPFQGKVEKKLVRTMKEGKIYAVSIPAPGPRSATGYLTIPDNAKPKSLPAVIAFFGYGPAMQEIPDGVPDGKIYFYLNAHGQELGRDAEYYKKFFDSIRSGKYSYAFDPEQNKNPETCFFNGMVMRILRTLEYMKTLPEWDGKNLSARGGSQGGLQTIWAAALDPDVTEAVSYITWCCDLAGTAKAKRISGSWRIAYVPGLDYYDPVFMAKRIKKADVTIGRAGLGDYVCPPSGLMICYKNLATPKKTIRWVQGSNHGTVPKKSEVIVWSTKKAPEKKAAPVKKAPVKQ